jgi:hypothetical protein
MPELWIALLWMARQLVLTLACSEVRRYVVPLPLRHNPRRYVRNQRR